MLMLEGHILIKEDMNRIAIVSIIIENNDNLTIQQINSLLHDYQNIILGRMGLPDKTHGVNIICVAICANENEINALTGKLGRVKGIQAKTLYSKNAY